MSITGAESLHFRFGPLAPDNVRGWFDGQAFAIRDDDRLEHVDQGDAAADGLGQGQRRLNGGGRVFGEVDGDEKAFEFHAGGVWVSGSTAEGRGG